MFVFIEVVLPLSLEKLSKLVNELEFRRENTFLYVIPGFLLPIAFILLLYIHYTALESLTEGKVGFIEGRILSFSVLMLIGYVASSSYLSYRLTKLISQHLYYSGIFSYYHARLNDDYEAIKSLFRSSLYRRSIPAPSTSLVINALTLGAFYPILLHVIESNLRKHVRGEEILFNKSSRVAEIDVKDLLLNIVALVFTLGLFLSYWGFRIINLYNNHVSQMHSVKPFPTPAEAVTGGIGGENILIKAIGLLYVGIGISIILGYLDIPTYPILTIGSSLLVPLIPLCLRKASIRKQIILSTLLIYLILYSSSIVGILNIEATGRVAYWLMDEFTRMRDEFGLRVEPYLIYIFLNNYALSVASSASPINTLLMGYSISNTGAILGGLTFISIMEGGLGYGLSTILIGFLPHSVLELFAYAIFVTLAVNMDKLGWRRSLSLFLIATAILLAAALVESLAIITGLRILQQL